MSHLQGRVVIVTGGGGGFGRLVSQLAAARGAKIAVADIDLDAAEETVALIEEFEGEAFAQQVDVVNFDDLAALANSALERYGAIDIMVNNAGTMPLSYVADHNVALDAWHRCIDINFKGVLNGMAAVHDAMIDQGRGQIINMSSIYGNYPVKGAAIYGATKAAVNFLSESLRQESQGKIKVTTIRPTGVPTTGLGAGVINGDAIAGILGDGGDEFMERFAAIMGGEYPEEWTDVEDIGYFSLAPEELAEQIIYAMDQPWGVSISDLTVRASGDMYMI